MSGKFNQITIIEGRVGASFYYSENVRKIKTLYFFVAKASTSISNKWRKKIKKRFKSYFLWCIIFNVNDILKANAKIICENEYTISENGLVAFSVMVVSSESATVRLTADGANATVLNCEGKNYLGEKFVKSVKIEKNRTKKFWITAASRGECRLYLKDESGETIAEKTVFIRSDGKRIDDPFKNGETMNRLFWLNSDKAIDHKVTKPFDKVSV